MNTLSVMNAEVYWIKDTFGIRCYRRNVPSLLNTDRRPMASATANDLEMTGRRIGTCGAYYDGDEPPCAAGEGPEEEDDYEITHDEKVNNYTTKIPIAKEYYKHIIGRHAETKNRFEFETKTRIDVPRIGQEGDVVISGSSRDSVASCRRRIEFTVDTARKRQPFTHFISFPFNSEEIVNKFTEFKKMVLEKCGQCRGIEESIFQIPERLHLTVGMLVLYSNLERTKAKETLESCKDDVIRPQLQSIEGPLKARIKGLNYMNDDPSDVNVLYGKVELLDEQNSQILQILSNSIVDYFVQKNVMPKKQYDGVKLHVTLMNSRHRTTDDDAGDDDIGPSNGPPARGFGRGHNNGFAMRESFDARKILEEFEDYDFGMQVINEVHISIRGGRRSGYYGCSAKVEL